MLHVKNESSSLKSVHLLSTTEPEEWNTSLAHLAQEVQPKSNHTIEQDVALLTKDNLSTPNNKYTTSQATPNTRP